MRITAIFPKQRFAYGALIAMIVFGCGCTQRQSSTIEQSHRMFGYVTLTDNSGFVLDESANAIAVGDVSLPATYCDDKSEYFCINSDVFYFAVPKSLTVKQKSWSLGGHTYHVVVPLHSMLLFGERIRVEIISTVGPKSVDSPADVTYFLYSPRHGLLAVESRLTGDLATDILWSTSRIGFGGQSVQ